MIQGFFFDLDGTLVDTHRANFEAYQRAIAEVSDVEITWEKFRPTIGHVAKTFLPRLVPGITDKELQLIAMHKARFYQDVMHLTRLNNGLIAFMDTVKGAQLVLVTTAKRANAQAVLEHHNLMGRFDYIITAEDVQESKPHPEAYRLALQKTGLRPSQAIAFEDSEAGCSAAEMAGLSVVLINNFAI